MLSKRSQLKEMVLFFNSLEKEKKEFIINCINCQFSVRLSNYMFSEEEISTYQQFISAISDLIESVLDEEKVIKTLTLAGLDKDIAKVVYDFCEGFLMQREDARAVESMSEESFEQAVDFVIDKMFLTCEYKIYDPEFIARKFGFHNVSEWEKALRFLFNQVYLVSKRDFSIVTLKDILSFNANLSEPKINLLFERIEENLTELYQYNQFVVSNRVLKKMEKIEKALDSFKTKSKSK